MENGIFTTHVKANLNAGEIEATFKALSEAISESKPFDVGAGAGEQRLWISVHLLHRCVVLLELNPKSL